MAAEFCGMTKKNSMKLWQDFHLFICQVFIDSYSAFPLNFNLVTPLLYVGSKIQFDFFLFYNYNLDFLKMIKHGHK